MNRSILVYGSSGCGKTRNAKRLANVFGLLQIVDDFNPHAEFCPRNGALLLTNVRPPANFPVTVMSFADAMRSLKAAP